jgi:ferritin-like metal-binding protein YciE
MNVQTTQDLFTRRLGDIHSSACFMAQHIPSFVSAAEGKDLRKVLNLYLDVVRDNADRTEAALADGIKSAISRDPTSVPAMVDDLFDLIDGIEEPSLVDTAILLSSTEIGSFEAQRLHLLADVADLMGQGDAKDALQECSQGLRTICDQFTEIIHSETAIKDLN